MGYVTARALGIRPRRLGRVAVLTVHNSGPSPLGMFLRVLHATFRRCPAHPPGPRSRMWKRNKRTRRRGRAGIRPQAGPVAAATSWWRPDPIEPDRVNACEGSPRKRS